MQKTGIITEERKNYYTVSCHDGSQYNALLKGVIRRKHRRLFVGDAADIEIFRDELDEKAVIRNVHTRRNKLERPPVANIDQVLLVCCIREPVVDTRYIDRFLFNASRLSVPVSLIFNKKDLLTEEDRNELAFYKECYSRIVSVVHAVTTKSPEETRRILTEICRGRCSVFAGPSGTGKSSLMKILFPDIPFRTSQLSRHISRGRNTTTHTSLLSLNRDSFIADTPGFSHTPLELVNPADVSRHFPDIAAHAGECAFRNCIHESEPRCAVKAAVETEDIEPERYYNYLDILDEVRNRSTYGKPSFRRR